MFCRRELKTVLLSHCLLNRGMDDVLALGRRQGWTNMATLITRLNKATRVVAVVVLVFAT